MKKSDIYKNWFLVGKSYLNKISKTLRCLNQFRFNELNYFAEKVYKLN